MKKRSSGFTAVVSIAVILLAVFLLNSSLPSLKNNKALSGSRVEGDAGSQMSTAPVDTESGNDSPYKYYVTQLNAAQQEAYYAVLNEIDAMPERIRIPTLSQNELSEMFKAVDYDNPRLFCIGADCRTVSIGSVTYLTIHYTMSYEEYQRQLAAVDEAADRILAALSAPADSWQTEREIHDAVILNTEYYWDESDAESSSPYGALVTGKAGCEGYARAAKLLFDKVGIESTVLSGKATDTDGQTGPHMWNAVKINGSWCHLDLTWDDPVGAAYTDYSYFNVTDAEIGLDHNGWHFSEKCFSNSQSYYYKKGLYCSEWSSSSPKALAAPVAKEITAGCKAVTLKFADEATYNTAVDALIDGQAVYKLLKNAENYTAVTFSTTSLQYTKNDNRLTVTLVPDFS